MSESGVIFLQNRLQLPCFSGNIPAKYRGTGYTDIRARIKNGTDRMFLDSAVDFDIGPESFPVQDLSQFPDLAERGRDQFLSAEARIHGHEQDHVRLVIDVIQNAERSSRIQGDASPDAGFMNLGKDTVQMRAGFGVYRDAVRSGPGKV